MTHPRGGCACIIPKLQGVIRSAPTASTAAANCLRSTNAIIPAFKTLELLPWQRAHNGFYLQSYKHVAHWHWHIYNDQLTNFHNAAIHTSQPAAPPDAMHNIMTSTCTYAELHTRAPFLYDERIASCLARS